MSTLRPRRGRSRRTPGTSRVPTAGVDGPHTVAVAVSGAGGRSRRDRGRRSPRAVPSSCSTVKSVTGCPSGPSITNSRSAPTGRFDDRGTQVERVAVRAHRQAGRPVARRGDSVGVAVGGVVARRLVAGRGLGPDGGTDDKPAAERQRQHDGERAELGGRAIRASRPSFMTMSHYTTRGYRCATSAAGRSQSDPSQQLGVERDDDRRQAHQHAPRRPATA